MPTANTDRRAFGKSASTSDSDFDEMRRGSSSPRWYEDFAGIRVFSAYPASPAVQADTPFVFQVPKTVVNLTEKRYNVHGGLLWVKFWLNSLDQRGSLCTAIGNSDHPLNQDCDTIQSHRKENSDGETKTKNLHPRV